MLTFIITSSFSRVPASSPPALLSRWSRTRLYDPGRVLGSRQPPFWFHREAPGRAGPLAGWGRYGGQRQKTLDLTGVDDIKTIKCVVCFLFFCCLFVFYSIKLVDRIPFENVPFIHNLRQGTYTVWHPWSGVRQVHLFLRYPNFVILLVVK